MSRRTPRRLGKPQAPRSTLRRVADIVSDWRTITTLGASVFTWATCGLDRWKDRPAKATIASTLSLLEVPEASERLKAVKALAALVREKRERVDLVFNGVVLLISRQTRWPVPLQPCDQKRDLLNSTTRYGPEVEAAFAFLRDFHRIELDSVIVLQQIDLTAANLNGADLRNFKFTEACLDSIQLMGAHIDRTDFTEAFLRGSRFDRANGTLVVFNRAKLHGAKFDSSTLDSAFFLGAELQRSSFTRADLRASEFSDAKLDWTSFRLAKLTEVSDWEEVDTNHLAGALFFESIELAADRAWLRRFGACVDSISVGEWSTRMIDPAVRDTTCGLPHAALRPGRRSSPRR